jgi:hypothetical protein
MNRWKRLGIIVLVGALVMIGSEVGEQYSVPGVKGPIQDAEAVVGRPLTPVSVAGVARRSVRRCAAGVYHC